ncbi:MAG: hypothetical protein JXB47_05805 [Anaerolineae bacterium]|nr:hypothetical protein [Anaerolineae bacterium]
MSIKSLHTLDAFRACEDLQVQVWQLHDRELVPDHIFLTSVRHGGVVLGAFAPGDAGEKMVGMLFGFPGLGDETFGVDRLHCSHIMGVIPEQQSKGIGYRLKLAQRAQVLQQGLKLVIWTYDPLEGRNAALNIGKLGAICRRYERNLYGDMRDALNAGLLSDRFEVEWWIDSEAVRCRLEEGKPETGRVLDAKAANRVTWYDGLPVPGDAPAAWKGEPALVEIPADFQHIRRVDFALAVTWRLHFRALCEAAFAAGYAVVDFASTVENGMRRSFYRLEP